MKFVLSTYKGFYEDDEEIEKLKELGFEFYDPQRPEGFTRNIEIRKCPTVEFESLEELVDFAKKYGEISIDAIHYEEPFSIEIFNR